MILMERKEDPEMILTNLGFGGAEGDGSTITRIPERFLSRPSYAEGIDLTTLIDDDESLGQILQAMAEGDDSMDGSRMTDMSESGKFRHFGKNVSLHKLVSYLIHCAVPVHFLNVQRVQEFLHRNNVIETQCQSKRPPGYYGNKQKLNANVSSVPVVKKNNVFVADVEMKHVKETDHVKHFDDHNSSKTQRPSSLDFEVREGDCESSQSLKSFSSTSTPSPDLIKKYYNAKVSSKESLV